jgi:hypothetical protein
MLNTCISPLEVRKGRLIITLPAANAARSSGARRVDVSSILGDIRYTLIFTAGEEKLRSPEFSGETYTISLHPGLWHVEAEARYISGDIAGRGSADAEISAEKDNHVNLTMAVADEFITPVISVQPQGADYTALDAPAPLTVTASVGFGTLSYQWYKTTAGVGGGGGGKPIPGANANTYTPGTTPGTTTYYYVTVTNSYPDTDGGTKTTSAASVAAAVTFTGMDGIVTPVISVQPQGASYAASATPAALTVTAGVGTGTLSYQWYTNTANNNSTGTAISGANSHTYTPPQLPGTTTYYYVVVTNSYTDTDGIGKTKTTASAVAAITFAVAASPDAMILAAALNAISAGSAEAAGSSVKLLADVTLTTLITVPAGVTLDLVTGHRSIILNDNAVLTVNGELNAEASHDDTNTEISGNGKILVASGSTQAATINGTGVIHLKSQGNLIYIRAGKEMILDGTVILDGLITAPTVSLAGITTLPSGFDDLINNTMHLISVHSGGTFTMNGGKICGNYGDGLAVNGSFTMNNGEIHANKAHTDGAGLIVNGGTFTMTGGVIKDNHANLGGGVRLYAGATFIMAGGTIYGSGAGTGLANTGSGASLSVNLGCNAYWGDGTTLIGTQNGTLFGGNPYGTVVP